MKPHSDTGGKHVVCGVHAEVSLSASGLSPMPKLIPQHPKEAELVPAVRDKGLLFQ